MEVSIVTNNRKSNVSGTVSDKLAVKKNLSRKFDHEFANEPLTAEEKLNNKPSRMSLTSDKWLYIDKNIIEIISEKEIFDEVIRIDKCGVWSLKCRLRRRIIFPSVVLLF